MKNVTPEEPTSQLFESRRRTVWRGVGATL
jgi:hypothetical protein